MRPERPPGVATQGLVCQGGLWRTCTVWPQASSATQSPCSSRWKPTIFLLTPVLASSERILYKHRRALPRFKPLSPFTCSRRRVKLMVPACAPSPRHLLGQAGKEHTHGHTSQKKEIAGVGSVDQA